MRYFLLVFIFLLCYNELFAQVWLDGKSFDILSLPVSLLEKQYFCSLYYRDYNKIGRNSFGIYGVLSLFRSNLFLLDIVHSRISYDKINNKGVFVGKAEEELWGGVIGYRYQLWDVDRPFLGLGIKVKYDTLDVYGVDTDITFYSQQAEILSPHVSLGFEDFGFVPKAFILLYRDIPGKILGCNYFAKGLYLLREQNLQFECGVGGMLYQLPPGKISNFVDNLEATFFVRITRYGLENFGFSISLNFRKTPSFPLFLGLRSTSYNNKYIGGSNVSEIYYREVVTTRDVKKLLEEVRELEARVRQIEGFNLGRDMIIQIKQLIKMGAYEQAKSAIEELREYLLEWEY